ncbi:MAG: 1-acyl-sn-glycerol-3-phosphate acyltransferase [Treponema sp.]|nr:1-acyl-sn-glycerol-3-phosphate acyltransferase [Treponema sp.]
MSSIIALSCAVGMLALPAILNIICYPVSITASRAISEYIVKVLAHRLFAIFSCYKHFCFKGYDDHRRELPDQFFLISNHQSLLDIPLYMNFFRDRDLRFVAKKELGRHIPVVSEMLRAQQHCLIARTARPVTAMRTLEKFGAQVRTQHQIPVLFPEGTRSRDGNVRKFYESGFRKLVAVTRLPVVVCALDGGWQMDSLGAVMRHLSHGTYRVKIVKIYPAPQTRAEELHILSEGSALITAQLTAWRTGQEA